MKLHQSSATLCKTALLALVCASLVSKAGAETYVVCFGIDAYATPTDKNGRPLRRNGKVVDISLKGCVNDANNWAKFFTLKANVDPKRLFIRLNSQVDGDGFVKTLRGVIGALKSRDRLVIVFSGHGTTYNDPSTLSGKSGAIILQDLSIVPNTVFTEIREYLNARGVDTTFIFDSCYSGAMAQTTPQFVEVRRKSAPAEVTKSVVITRTPMLADLKLRPTAAVGSWSSLAASKETQVALDVKTVDGVRGGAFSINALKTLNARPSISIAALEQSIARALAEAGVKTSPVFKFGPESRGTKPVEEIPGSKPK